MVVTLHLVVEDLALLRGGVGDQLGLDDLQDVVTDVRQFGLDLRLVVADQGKLVALKQKTKQLKNKDKKRMQRNIF